VSLAVECERDYKLRMRMVLAMTFFFCAVALRAGEAAPVAVAPDAEAPAPTEYPRKQLLADVHEVGLLARLPDPPFTLIDARSASAYAANHIRGSYNIPSDDFQDTNRPPTFLPAPEVLQKTFADARIHKNRRVIVYDENDGRLAARVWFTLHACGHDDVAILLGGLTQWKDAGKDLTDALPRDVPPGTFVPAETLRGVATFNDLAQFRVRVQAIGGLPPTTLIDARSTREYSGDDARAKHGGHIPAAANIEWSALMTGKDKARVWRPAAQIHALLRLSGVDKKYAVCVYDQAGGRSAHLYFTLWLMGFDRTVNYVAGWREYGNRDDVEVER